MAQLRVEAFKKILSITSGRSYGSVIIKFERVAQKELIQLEDLTEFLCLVHMLEHDIVYYDTDNKVFQSQKEYSRPTPLRP